MRKKFRTSRKDRNARRFTGTPRGRKRPVSLEGTLFSLPINLLELIVIGIVKVTIIILQILAGMVADRFLHWVTRLKVKWQKRKKLQNP